MRCSGYRKHCPNYKPYSDDEDICTYLDDWDNPEWDNCCNPPKMICNRCEKEIDGDYVEVIFGNRQFWAGFWDNRVTETFIYCADCFKEE